MKQAMLLITNRNAMGKRLQWVRCALETPFWRDMRDVEGGNTTAKSKRTMTKEHKAP